LWITRLHFVEAWPGRSRQRRWLASRVLCASAERVSTQRDGADSEASRLCDYWSQGGSTNCPPATILRLPWAGVNGALSGHRLPHPLAEPLTKGGPVALSCLGQQSR